MNPDGSKRRLAIVWAVIGGLVLLAVIITMLVVLLTPPSSSAVPTPSATGKDDPTPTSSAPAPDASAVVDETAADRGLVAEPITRDVETYAIAALEAAATFDTNTITRDEFIDYLGTWISGDPYYAESEGDDPGAEARDAIGHGVILPPAEWDAVANEFGTSSAKVTGDVEIEDAGLYYDGEGQQRNVYADVVVTYMHKAGADGSEGETSYEDRVRVGVQVLCGDTRTQPAPNSAQTAGDCKVIKWLQEVG